MKASALIGSPIVAFLLLSTPVAGEPCPEGTGEQKTPPATETSADIKVEILAELDLGDQAIAAKGWHFRTRLIVFPPGAKVALHSHDKRPEMATMKVGEVAIYQVGCKSPSVMREGDVHVNGHGVSHWAVNETDRFAIMYVTDIFNSDSFPSDSKKK